MNTFSKKTKIIISLISVCCVVLATIGGVLSANMLANFSFGDEIALESLDNQTDAGTINILLLGVDDGGMRSDTIMLASLNGRTGRLSVLSIPRDTRVQIGKYYQKINAAIGIGYQEVKKGNLKEPEDLTVQKVKLLTGLPVHYFMSVNFDGFMEIIDAVDGVEFNVPFHMKYDDPVQGLHIDLQPGLQTLDGKKAHDFVRFRKGNAGYPGYAMGDLGRIEAQQAFIKALISQKVTAKYLMKADEIFDVVCKNVRTNYTGKDLIKHLGSIRKITSDKMNMYQLPGTSQTINGASYFICDDAKTAELVERIFSPSASFENENQEAGQTDD